MRGGQRVAEDVAAPGGAGRLAHRLVRGHRVGHAGPLHQVRVDVDDRDDALDQRDAVDLVLVGDGPPGLLRVLGLLLGERGVVHVVGEVEQRVRVGELRPQRVGHVDDVRRRVAGERRRQLGLDAGPVVQGRLDPDLRVLGRERGGRLALPLQVVREVRPLQEPDAARCFAARGRTRVIAAARGEQAARRRAATLRSHRPAGNRDGTYLSPRHPPSSGNEGDWINGSSARQDAKIVPRPSTDGPRLSRRRGAPRRGRARHRRRRRRPRPPRRRSPAAVSPTAPAAWWPAAGSRTPWRRAAGARSGRRRRAARPAACALARSAASPAASSSSRPRSSSSSRTNAFRRRPRMSASATAGSSTFHVSGGWTIAPCPWRTLATRRSSSARSASRTVPRATSNLSAISCSLGSREPGG